MRTQNWLKLARNEEGASLVELALLMPFFLLLTFGAVDFGRVFYLANEVAGAAHAGALYGSQNPADTTGIEAAAQDDAPDVPNLSVGTPTYGCECADGTQYSVNCTVTLSCSDRVNRVDLKVTGTYTPLVPWPGIPSSMSFSSSASMRSGGS